MIRDLDFLGFSADLLGVLTGQNSLEIVFAYHLPSIFSLPDVKSNSPYRFRGIDFYSVCKPFTEVTILSHDQYSIPECHVNPGDIVFDCGAFTGIFSYLASEHQASNVYAFEPTMETFSVLVKNIDLWRLLSKIHPINMGIYSENKQMPLYLDSLPEGNTIYQNMHKGESKVEIIELITLDSFVKKHKIHSVDFIKMDIEGAEIDALQGAREIIEEFKPRMAISGYHRPDDLKDIPECVLSFRDDYSYKIEDNPETDIYFW